MLVYIKDVIPITSEYDIVILDTPDEKRRIAHNDVDVTEDVSNDLVNGLIEALFKAREEISELKCRLYS